MKMMPMHESKSKETGNNLAKFGESLFQRAVRGGVWVFALRITERAFGLIRLIILARILAPHDFGLMGIALLTMAALNTFSQTGFHTALIQKKDNTDSYLNAAWTVSILRGLLLFAILFFIAPYAAIFFKAAEAQLIIRVIGLSVLLQAFINIGVVHFQKELEFNKQFVYQLSGTLADFIVTISAVLVLRSVWALVFGLLAGNVTRLIASYSIHPYRPRLSLDTGKAKELFNFGKWVLGSSVLIFLITQGDDIFVGKLLGATMLGFYQLAYRISNMPTTEITHVISQVTFPAYSKLQDNLPRLREAYLKTLQIVTFLSFPIAGLIFVLAPDFTKLFLGEKWMPMVPAMQVLAFAGLARSIAATPGETFYAIGRPKIDTKLQVVRLFVLVILIYPFAIEWGILGVSVTVFLSIFVSNVGFILMALRVTKCKIREFAETIIIPLISGIIMVVSLLFLKTYVNITGVRRFLLFLIAGSVIYLSVIYVIDRFRNHGIYPLIHKCLKELRWWRLC